MTTVVLLAGVGRSIHSLYATSWIEHRLRNDGGDIVVVDTDADRRSRGGEPTSIRWYLPDDERVGFAAEPPGAARDVVLLSVGTPALRPWLRERLRRRRLTSVVIDEGLGSYGGVVSRGRALHREGSGWTSAIVRAVVRTVATRLTRRHWSLYRRTPTGWGVSDDVANAFRTRTPRDLPERRAAVVFLSQPWVDLGVLDESVHLDHVRRLDAAVTAAGLEFLVRPHPHEPGERYAEFNLVPNDEPAELQATCVSAVAVLGETTSALLNLAGLHGVDAIRVRGPAFDHVAPSRRQESLFRSIVGPVVGIDDLVARLS